MGRFDQLTQLDNQRPRRTRQSDHQPAQPKRTEGKSGSPSNSTPMEPQRPNARTGQQVNAPTPERPNGKRVLVRDSFDIYQDQIEALRILSFQEKLEGRLGSIAQMVREAIDAYLQNHTSQK